MEDVVFLIPNARTFGVHRIRQYHRLVQSDYDGLVLLPEFELGCLKVDPGLDGPGIAVNKAAGGEGDAEILDLR